MSNQLMSCSGQAQDCSGDTVSITRPFQEVLLNRSIPQSCLQCLDLDLSVSVSLFWIVSLTSISGLELELNAGAMGGFENVNGVLVLEQPMELLGDGATNSLVVDCLSPRGSILGVTVYSSGMHS